MSNIRVSENDLLLERESYIIELNNLKKKISNIEILLLECNNKIRLSCNHNFVRYIDCEPCAPTTFYCTKCDLYK